MKLTKNDAKNFERKLTAQSVKDSPFSADGFNVSVEIIGPATPWQGCGLVLDPPEVASVVAEMVAWLAEQATSEPKSAAPRAAGRPPIDQNEGQPGEGDG